MDVSRLAFVPRTTIGRDNETLCQGPRVLWLDDTIVQSGASNEVDEVQRPKPVSQCEIRETHLTFGFPNLWENHVPDKIRILAFFIPVDEEKASSPCALPTA